MHEQAVSDRPRHIVRRYHIARTRRDQAKRRELLGEFNGAKKGINKIPDTLVYVGESTRSKPSRHARINLQDDAFITLVFSLVFSLFDGCMAL